MYSHSTTKQKGKKPRLVVLGTDLVYRTASQTRAGAEATHRMFAANPRFIGTELVSDPHKPGFFYVALVPANPDRIHDMFQRFVEERRKQAENEAADWIWSAGDQEVATPHLDRETGVIVWHLYGLDAQGRCDCLDSQERCSRIGEYCKHDIEREKRKSERAADLAATIKYLNETGELPGEEPGQFSNRQLPTAAELTRPGTPAGVKKRNRPSPARPGLWSRDATGRRSDEDLWD